MIFVNLELGIHFVKLQVQPGTKRFQLTGKKLYIPTRFVKIGMVGITIRSTTNSLNRRGVHVRILLVCVHLLLADPRVTNKPLNGIQGTTLVG
jgi:hypothetical protein